MPTLDVDSVGVLGEEIDCQFKDVINVLDCLVVEVDGSRSQWRSLTSSRPCLLPLDLCILPILSMLR